MGQSMRRMSIHEGNYEDERNANSYNVSPTSRSNSSAATQEAYHSGTHHQELLPRNAYARSNSEPTKLKRSPTNSKAKKISTNTACSNNSSNNSSLSKSSPPPPIK